MAPRITAAVCTHNRSQILGDCLDSLLAQALPAAEYEVVVVDDGCSDATGSVVEAYASRRPGLAVRHLPQPHAGLNAARNRALREARGEVVCFLDDDELAPPTHLGLVLARLEQHPDLAGVGGPYRDYGGQHVRTCSRCSLAAHDMGQKVQLRAETLLGGNMALRRSAHARVGDFEVGLSPKGSARGDERSWFQRGVEAGLHFGYFPDLWISHRRDTFGLWELCRHAFMQGSLLPVSHATRGLSYSPSAVRLGRFLGHAGLRGCAQGLVLAFREIGATWTCLRRVAGLGTPSA